MTYKRSQIKLYITLYYTATRMSENTPGTRVGRNRTLAIKMCDPPVYVWIKRTYFFLLGLNVSRGKAIDRREKEERKYALTIASYTCKRRHVWRTKATWTNDLRWSGNAQYTSQLVNQVLVWRLLGYAWMRLNVQDYARICLNTLEYALIRSNT